MSVCNGINLHILQTDNVFLENMCRPNLQLQGRYDLKQMQGCYDRK